MSWSRIDAGTILRRGSDTGGPEPTGLVVYNESLQSPWIDASWNASVAFGSAEQAYQGTTSIKTTLSSAWGALSLHFGNWGSEGINTANYGSFDFALYPLSVGSNYTVFFENDQGQAFPKADTGPISANAWTPVSIPMDQLNPSGLIVNRFAIQDLSGQQLTFYIDNLLFAGAVNGGSMAGRSESFVSMPSEYGLLQNYPNPFNPTTTIRYWLPEDSDVSLEVYVLGQRIQTTVYQHQKAGYHQIQFQGSGIASGIYFYRLIARPSAGGKSPFVQIKKMFLVK